jgi:catechol 2,3-dioxygenase-like lactoylglutathione lyase family enzyme
MGKSTPVLSGLNPGVKDVEASLAFYRKLGLEIPDTAIWRTESGPHHVAVSMPNGIDFDLDSAQLATSYNAGWTADSAARSVIGFSLPAREAVDERYGELISLPAREAVDERYGELIAAGYTGLQPPYDAFWGARYAIVEDPDGNQVGLMSPLDPARRGAPPSV